MLERSNGLQLGHKIKQTSWRSFKPIQLGMEEGLFEDIMMVIKGK